MFALVAPFAHDAISVDVDVAAFVDAHSVFAPADAVADDDATPFVVADVFALFVVGVAALHVRALLVAVVFAPAAAVVVVVDDVVAAIVALFVVVAASQGATRVHASQGEAMNRSAHRHMGRELVVGAMVQIKILDVDRGKLDSPYLTALVIEVC